MAADEEGPKNADDAAAPGGQPGGERRAQERRQRPPVTIDLAAQDVAAKPSAPEAKAEPARPEAPKPAEKPAAEKAKAGRAPEDRRASDRLGAGAQAIRGAAARAFHADDAWRRSAYAGIVGGVLAFVLVLVLQAMGLLPAPGRSTATLAFEQARNASDTATALERRITAMEAMTEGLAAMRSDIRSLSDRVAALEEGRSNLAARSDVQAVSTAVATLRQQFEDAPPSATRGDLDAIGERIGRLEAAVAAGTGGGASEAAMTSLSAQINDARTTIRALADRVNATETRVNALGAPVTGGEAAVRAVAISSLRRSAADDTPFAADLDLVATLGLAGDAVARLRPMAATGVASKATLAAEFPAVADAALAAVADGNANAGFVRRVVDGLGSLVTIRPTGPIAGSAPAAVISRMADAVGKGDLATALAEREALPPAGQEATAAWAAKASDRVTLDNLVDAVARSFEGPAE
jgi:hypothetical protein